MTGEFVTEYLALSDKLRNGYRASLGTASGAWRKTVAAITADIPDMIAEIYGNVAGTYREIGDQRFMDFVPGYRLIHIAELEREYHTLLQVMETDDACEAQIETVIPLLSDDSSCYICYVRTTSREECVFHYTPEDGLQKMHDSVELFFQTILEFYRKGVFYLDQDGFLDYDYEKEEKIGAVCNPGIAYWTE